MINQTVVVVEDDKALGFAYEQGLKDLGATILLAHTATDGLKLIQEHHPKVVLLDVMLGGGMNGFDLLEQLKRDEHLKSIPVLMLTNLDSEEKLALEIGAEEYLVKANISMGELSRKIWHYLLSAPVQS